MHTSRVCSSASPASGLMHLISLGTPFAHPGARPLALAPEPLPLLHP
jgi:hypothetical protein